jgi:arabinofuranosyltransferase
MAGEDTGVRDSRESSLAAGLLATLFLSAAALHSVIPRSMMDDAYISFRYSRNLAQGLGMVFNPGERVEGYTNFLWVLLGTLAESLGTPSAVVMPLVGVFAGVALVWLVARASAAAPAGAAAPPRFTRFSGVLAAAAVAVHPALLFYAGTGLETVLYALLVTAALVAAAHGRTNLFVVTTALAFLTRPEAGLLGLVGVAWLVLRVDSASRARAFAGLAIRFAVLLGPYLAWKVLYFGSVLPLTLLAKTPVPAQAVKYTLESAAPTVALAAIATAALWSAPKGAPERLYLGFWWATAASLCFVGPDWMPAGRLLAPAFPALAMALEPAAVRLASAAGASLPKHRVATAGRALLAAALVAYVAVSIYQNQDLLVRFRGRAEGDVQIARMVHDLEQRGARSIATVNIGLIGYVAPNMRVLDLVGLTDAHIGRLPGAHLRKEPGEAYLRERAADVYVLTSSEPIGAGPGGQATYKPDFHVENHVFRMPWFRENHRYLGTLALGQAYFYHVFVRPSLLPAP